ncbi:hypothetical protein ACLESO_17535, partial [Pyxidicoccus sp. 3LG]
RLQKAAEEKAAADARKAAEQPGQPLGDARKSQADVVAAEKRRQQAAEKLATEEKKLQSAEEKLARAAKRAEDAMRKANTLAAEEKQPPPFTEQDIDGVNPESGSVSRPVQDEKPLAALDAVNAGESQPAPLSPGKRSPEQSPVRGVGELLIDLMRQLHRHVRQLLPDAKHSAGA